MSGLADWEAAKVYIGGEVQGVFFRASAQERANDLGLGGWVRNMADGRVEVFAQGPRSLLDVFVHWLHDGPTAARVDEVHIVEAPVQPGFTRFEIRR